MRTCMFFGNASYSIDYPRSFLSLPRQIRCYNARRQAKRPIPKNDIQTGLMYVQIQGKAFPPSMSLLGLSAQNAKSNSRLHLRCDFCVHFKFHGFSRCSRFDSNHFKATSAKQNVDILKKRKKKKETTSSDLNVHWAPAPCFSIRDLTDNGPHAKHYSSALASLAQVM